MSTPQIDESVMIPAAVKAAGAAAEAYYQQEAQGTANGDQEAKPEEISAEIEAKEPEARQEETKSGVTFESSPEAKPEDEQSWEHRYKSMKGRFDRSQDQIRSLSEQIQSLQGVISTMQATSPAPASAEAEAAIERLITPEEESDYGSEFLKVVGKKAREELLPVINKYEAKIAQLEGQLQGVGGKIAQDARQHMLTQLDERLPNWREINRDETFLNWLQLPDLYSGAIRHELLKAAYERNDAPRVAAFFTGFLAEEAAVAPANGEAGRSEAPAKPSLDQFAAPGRAKSAAATTAPAEKPFFTRAQIAKFYADAAAGKYRGRDADRDRLEKQIFDAQREGRIR
jgi:hypothetical protein